ncbi:MAG: hypothetical protein IE922_06600 [Sphingomonadales bacterium]|nr:hypothetical protein [Sphingomonadales bacterium]
MTIGVHLGKPLKFAHTLLLGAALALSGCLPAPSAEELRATSDQCSKYRTPFTRISQERDLRIEAYAKIGSTLGATVGVAIAKQRDENEIAGMLLGALAGAALGATSGYLSDLQKRATSTAGLQKAVNGDASRDLRATDALIVAMSSLNRCRLSQIAAVEKSVRAGGDRTAARATIAQIRRSVDVDNRVINAVVGDLTRTRSLYVGALRQTGADTDQFVASIQQYRPKVSSPQQTSLQVSRAQRPRTTSPVANLGYAEKELSAGAAAHVQRVDSALDDLKELLI